MIIWFAMPYCRLCNTLTTPHKGESITAEETNIPATKYSSRFLK